MKKNRNIWIIDSTLRDGLQSPGVVLSYREREILAQMLIDAGVNELEAGVPMIGPEEQSFLSRLTQKHQDTRITGWTRAREKDLYDAARAGLKSVHFAFPISPMLLQTYQKDWCWVMGRMFSLIKTARELFDFVSVGAMDAFRCDIRNLAIFVKQAEKWGAHRVRLSDTVGTASPAQVKRYFKKMSRGKIFLEFHGHNDIGLATANSLAALEGGADALSLTVNGVGERAGNAPIEQIAAAIPFCGDWKTSLRNEKLKGLSAYFEEQTGMMIEAGRPIVGDQVFTHESGIHVQALMKDKQSYCQLDPEHYGRSHRFVAGSHSGSDMIRIMLMEQGIEIDRASAAAFLKDVRNAAEAGKGWLDSRDLRVLYLMLENRDLQEEEPLKCSCGMGY